MPDQRPTSSTTTTAAPTCRHCNTPLQGPYCHVCGQAVAKRISWASFSHRFWDRYLDLDHGIPYTVWQLIIRPGHTIREYLAGNRVAYTDPVKLLLLIASVVTVLMIQTDVMEAYLKAMPAASTGTNKAELLRLQQELTAKMLEYTQVWLLFLVPVRYEMSTNGMCTRFWNTLT